MRGPLGEPPPPPPPPGHTSRARVAGAGGAAGGLRAWRRSLDAGQQRRPASIPPARTAFLGLLYYHEAVHSLTRAPACASLASYVSNASLQAARDAVVIS